MPESKCRENILDADGSHDRDSLSDECRKALEAAGLGPFFRARDWTSLGFAWRDLAALLRTGAIEQVARGLYRIADAELTQHHTIAAVCARVPSAIVCLLSALAVHEIGTQLPAEVWIGIPHKARAPKVPELPIRIVRFSGPALVYGVDEAVLEGVPARITSPARTVVDCFRFRRVIGRDVAVEALREVLNERKATPDELCRAADVCRARSLVMPVLEALLS